MVRMNTERQVAKRLNSLGFETFVPAQTETHKWSDRRKKVERLILPLYVFVKTEADKTQELKDTYSFIYGWMKAPGETKPAAVPDDQIQRFKYMIGQCDILVSMEAMTVKLGSNVRVLRGSLQGLTGTICICEDGPKVGIRIDCIGYACLQIAKSDLEII